MNKKSLKGLDFDTQIKKVTEWLNESDKKVELASILSMIAARKISDEIYLVYFESCTTNEIEDQMFSDLCDEGVYIDVVLKSLGSDKVEDILNNTLLYIKQSNHMHNTLEDYKDMLVEKMLADDLRIRGKKSLAIDESLEIITSVQPFGHDYFIHDGMLHYCTGNFNGDGIEYSQDFCLVSDIENIEFRKDEIEIVADGESIFLTKDGVTDEFERQEEKDDEFEGIKKHFSNEEFEHIVSLIEKGLESSAVGPIAKELAKYIATHAKFENNEGHE